MTVIPSWVEELQEGLDALQELYTRPRTTILKLVRLANEYGIEIRFRFEKQAAQPPGGVDMPTIAFEGGSDDLVEVEGPVWDANGEAVVRDSDEFGAFASDPKRVNAVFRICPVDAKDANPSEHEGEECVVEAHYGTNGCWLFAVGMADGGLDDPLPLPLWPMRVGNSKRETPYSTRLEIDVPDGYAALLL